MAVTAAVERASEGGEYGGVETFAALEVRDDEVDVVDEASAVDLLHLHGDARVAPRTGAVKIARGVMICWMSLGTSVEIVR